MLAISIVNLILSIFGITASSIFILFWCGRYFCARFFIRRMPESRRLFFFGTTHSRAVAGHSTVGVSPLVIAYFPTITFHQDMSLPRQDPICAVCLGEYKEEELLRMLPQCGHNFHASCIDAWLQRHATCPVCRMSLQGYFVGRTLATLQSMPLQPTASTLDQTASDPGSRMASGHSDGMSSGILPSGSSNVSAETTVSDNPLVLNISSSEACNSSDSCISLEVQTPRLDEHGSLSHCVERS